MYLVASVRPSVSSTHGLYTFGTLQVHSNTIWVSTLNIHCYTMLITNVEYNIDLTLSVQWDISACTVDFSYLYALPVAIDN